MHWRRLLEAHALSRVPWKHRYGCLQTLKHYTSQTRSSLHTDTPVTPCIVTPVKSCWISEHPTFLERCCLLWKCVVVTWFSVVCTSLEYPWGQVCAMSLFSCSVQNSTKWAVCHEQKCRFTNVEACYSHPEDSLGLHMAEAVSISHGLRCFLQTHHFLLLSLFSPSFWSISWSLQGGWHQQFHQVWHLPASSTPHRWSCTSGHTPSNTAPPQNLALAGLSGTAGRHCFSHDSHLIP